MMIYMYTMWWLDHVACCTCTCTQSSGKNQKLEKLTIFNVGVKTQGQQNRCQLEIQTLKLLNQILIINYTSIGGLYLSFIELLGVARSYLREELSWPYR